MADISAQPVLDYGSLLSSYGQGQANIGQTQAQTAFINGPQTQQAQASAGLTNAQTGLVNQQAKKAAFEVQMIQNAMKSMEAISPDQNTVTDQSTPGDPTETGIASYLNKKLGYVDPMGPPGMQQYINATAWVNPQESQRASDWRDKVVAAKKAQNQNEANDIWQTASALENSNTGVDGLISSTPKGSFLNNTGLAIKSMGGKSDAEKDDMARAAIASAAKYSHQYTGRPVDYSGDQPVDKDTKQPVFGVPKAGLTAEQKVDFGKWANTPQTVTIDGRDATVKPKDLGITSPQDVTGNKSVKFSSAPPAPQPGQPGGAQTPAQVRQSAAQEGNANPQAVQGLNPDQQDFVKSQPPAYKSIPGNQKPNAIDVPQASEVTKQYADLAKKTNLETNEANNTLVNVKRISSILQTPGLTLGPGSQEYSQLQTALNQWFGTPAGNAAAYQVLNKILNANEMQARLKELHESGGNVRVGAFETNLIMQKLAANPSMTKEAIGQMLAYESSDSNYILNKARTASALMGSGKSVANFDTNYESKFPPQNTVETGFRTPSAEGQNYDYSKAPKTVTRAQAEEAAAHYGIPSIQFRENLQKAGVQIQ